MEFVPVILYLIVKLFSAAVIALGVDLSWFAFGLRSRARYARRFILPLVLRWLNEQTDRRLVPLLSK